MPYFKLLIFRDFRLQTLDSRSTERVLTRQKCRAVRDSGPLAHILGALCVLTSTAPCAASDLELDGSIALGFDSNPAQTRTGPELAFARYAVEALRSWSTSDGHHVFSLSGGGWYRDYEAANDAYRLNLISEWSRETASGLGLWRFELAGSAYRDALVPADERDEAGVGVRYDHLLSARHTLGLRVDVRRLDYLHATLPWAGRPGSASNSGSGRTMTMGDIGRNDGQSAQHRDDTNIELGLDVTRHWSRILSTRLSLTHAENDSSIHLERYRRPGLSGSMRLEPSKDWWLEAGASWSLTRYAETPRHREREDRQFGLSLAVRHRLAKYTDNDAEWQCRLEWLDSDSTLADYSFQQWVTQCGLSWSLF